MWRALELAHEPERHVNSCGNTCRLQQISVTHITNVLEYFRLFARTSSFPGKALAIGRGPDTELAQESAAHRLGRAEAHVIRHALNPGRRILQATPGGVDANTLDESRRGSAHLLREHA